MRRAGTQAGRGFLGGLLGSEVPREFALFTAVEGGVVEEGAGGAVPMRALVLLLTSRVWGKGQEGGQQSFIVTRPGLPNFLLRRRATTRTTADLLTLDVQDRFSSA